MSDIRILILQRSHVVIGRYSRDVNEVIMRDASIVRTWGTTKGLGQLRSGPTPNTVLNPCGTFRVHPLAIIGSIDCDSAAWEGKLPT